MNTSSILKWRVTRIGFLVLVTLVVGASAITTQSLWIDEGNAIVKAMMPSLKDMWKFSAHLRGSEIQMPLFMISLWSWDKVVPSTEYFLRALNLPFLVMMVLAFRRYRFWPWVCLTSPFVLYYVGELRPYMFQMAGAAVGFSALCRMLGSDSKEPSTKGLHALIFSCLFLAATSLTAALFSIGLVMGLLIARPRILQTSGFWKKTALWSPLAVLIAAYYAYTLIEGYRATGDRGGGLLSMGFGFYEMIGLLGLGPARNELRNGDILGLLIGHPWIPLAALAIFVTWWIGLKEFAASFSVRSNIGLVCAIALPIIVLAAIGVLANFSVLGRHMSPLIPAFLLPLACACEVAVRNLKSKKPRVASLVASVLACGIISSVIITHSGRHARDDYRRATIMAIDALSENRAIIWKADMNCVRYYAYREGGMQLVNRVQRLESDVPSSLLFADLVFINRPDLRFGGANYQAELILEGFEPMENFTGFEVWKNRHSDIR